jgi:hypothetical protein
MFTVPQKTEARLASGIKKFRRVIATAKKKDLNESDTVTIITDIFSEVFGYDRYSEITSEYAIRGTYCDLAIKLGSALKILVECKAVGIKLKDNHLRQALDYGAKEGIDWVILTNGEEWMVYKIKYRKPIGYELVFEFLLSEMRAQKTDDIDKLYALSKEGLSKQKSALTEMYEQGAILNKYMLGQLLLEDATLSFLKRLLKKISPDAKIESDSISDILQLEVIKREIIESENTKDYRRVIRRRLGPAKKKRRTRSSPEPIKEEPIAASDVEDAASNGTELVIIE